MPTRIDQNDPTEDLDPVENYFALYGHVLNKAYTNTVLAHYRRVLADKQKAEDLRDLYQGELGKCKLELNEMAEDCTSWMERAEKAEATLKLRDIDLQVMTENCHAAQNELAEVKEALKIQNDHTACRNTVGRLEVENARLREALEKLLKRFVRLVESGDCGFWGVEEDEVVILARDVLGDKGGKGDA